MVNPTGSVSAVPTHYSGVLFRSKLEADWAATFDHLGWIWEPEPVALYLNNRRRYLPDFYLPGQQVWVEVKGPHNLRIDKPRQLAAQLRSAALVVVARPARNGYADWHAADGAHWIQITLCGACDQWCFNPLYRQPVTWRCRHCGLEKLVPEASYLNHASRAQVDDLGYWYPQHGALSMARAYP